MTRFLPSAVVLKVLGLLVLSFTSTSNGLSLEDRMLKLTKNYDKIADALTTKNAQFEALEKKVQQQESKFIRLEALELKVEEQELEMVRLKAMVIQQQESLPIVLKKEKPTYPKLIPSNSLLPFQEQSAIVGKSMFPRTCREVRSADPSLSSGMHWIDPDGQGVGDDPIYVYCDMNTGSTSVLHDTESSIDVGHCADPGCYSRSINYNATMRQMNALADLSNECHQSIQYDCNYAPFVFDDVTFAWWNDRNGNSQTFWAGSNTASHTCQCGIDQNCVDASVTCNCDVAAPVPLTDSGVITDKNYLPINRLNFGRTQLSGSSGVHTLGRLQCIGQVAINGMPKSCTDLWRIGHTFSGLYLVMGSTQIESVYCDFTKLYTCRFRIGNVDVKSLPVYFYVQRNSHFGTLGVPIPFELERLNVGGSMNLASGIFTAPRSGTYFFSFSGFSEDGGLWIGLYVNESRTGAGYSDATYKTFSLQSALRLNAGDQISMRIYGGLYLYDNSSEHFTHFTGWLLQEDLSS